MLIEIYHLLWYNHIKLEQRKFFTVKTIRWGVVGPGKIAKKFARSVAQLPQCEIAAVCGTSMEKAQKFAEEFGIPRAFCDHNQMASIKELDAVYIATPHNSHASFAEIYIKAGKHILCEKPLCVNTCEAEQMLALAEANNTFLMEAMWVRFLPSMRKAKELIESGAIGEIRSLRCSICAAVPKDCARMYRNDLAGGALLDTGVYNLHFAHTFLGQPQTITAFGDVRDGVDYQTSMTLCYENGAIAELFTAMDHRQPMDAYIFGTKGFLRFPTLFGANEVYLTVGKEPELRFDCPRLGEGLEEEILEVCSCMEQGKTQSAIHPMGDTIAVLKQMDEIRRQIGLRYPADSLETVNHKW